MAALWMIMVLGLQMSNSGLISNELSLPKWYFPPDQKQ